MVTRAASGAVQDDITIPQGAAWSRSWSITDANGTALTVDNWSVQAQIRHSHDDTVLFEWNTTSGTGIGEAEASGSTVTIELDGSESVDWTWDSAYYDVYLTDLSGTPTRIVEGRVTLSLSVTHS